ncbi:MAG: DALR anticodon-binding domain-containing protein [Ferruginibacter sp.]
MDFHGFTGPFIQYTYARIKSILRKNEVTTDGRRQTTKTLSPLEKELIVALENNIRHLLSKLI